MDPETWPRSVRAITSPLFGLVSNVLLLGMLILLAATTEFAWFRIAVWFIGVPLVAAVILQILAWIRSRKKSTRVDQDSAA